MKITFAPTVKDLIEILSLVDPNSTWNSDDDGCLCINIPDQYEHIEEGICPSDVFLRNTTENK